MPSVVDLFFIFEYINETKLELSLKVMSILTAALCYTEQKFNKSDPPAECSESKVEEGA